VKAFSVVKASVHINPKMKTSTSSATLKPGRVSRINALALAVALVAPAAFGQTFYTNNSTGDFNVATSWNPNTVPSGSVNAANDNGSNNIVLIQPGDPLWQHGDTLAGQTAGLSGAYLQTGSTNNTGGGNWLRMGIGVNSFGSYVLSNGLVNVGGRIQIGEKGAGYLEISGGTMKANVNDTSGNANPGLGVANGEFAVVPNNTPSGTVVLNNGTLTIQNETWIGDGNNNSGSRGTGHFIMHGGTLNLNNWFVFGRFGAVGDGYMDGGVINKNNNGNVQLGVGSMNNGTTPGQSYFTQVGGTFNCASEYQVGTDASITQSTNDIGGTAVLKVDNTLTVGRGGALGVLNISGNAAITKTGVNGGNVTIGSGTTGNGTVNQNGGAFTNTATQTLIGDSGTGRWNMTNGMAILGTVILANASSGNGTLTLNGGLFQVASITSPNPSATTVLDFNGGILQANTNSSTFIKGLAYGLIDAGGAVIDSQGYNLTIPQSLSESASGGNFTKNGTGTITFTGTNAYSGTTTVNAGKLAVNIAGQQTSGAYVVGNNAELSITVPFHNAQLNMSGFTLGGAAATLDIDLGAGGNPTGGSAPVNVGGPLALNGTVAVNIADITPQLGQFPLVNYSSKTGSGSFVLASLPSGVGAYLSNNVSSLDLVITNVNLPRWEGQAGGNWDIGLTTNWINIGTGSPTFYTDGNSVLLDDEATGTTAINLVANVNPLAVTFNNTNLIYTITGNGRINGNATVTLQGAGTVNLLTTNGYTGPTVISGGILSVTNLANGGLPSAIGASSSNSTSLVLAGGAFSYSGPAVTINRGYQTQATNSTLTTVSNLTLTGHADATLVGGLNKSGLGQLTYATVGSNVLSGASSPGYNVADGSVVFDGSAGGQTNYVGGGPLSLNGLNSVATVLITNSVFNVGDIDPGNLGNSTDVLTIAGNSTVNSTGWLIFGDGGNVVSTLNLNNATLNLLNGKVLMGGRAGDTSILNINGGILNNAGANGFDIGDGGWNGAGARTGIVNQTGGSNNINTALSIGNTATGIGFYNLTNGLLGVSGEIDVANGGAAGTFNIANGTVNAGSWFVTGRAGSTNGTLNMTGGVLNKSSSGNFLIGSSAGNNTTTSVGNFNISGGVLTCASEYWLGENFLDIGTNNISGTAVVNWQNWVSIGRSGLGVINFSGGTITRTGAGQSIAIGDNVGGPGKAFFNQSGGTLTSSAELWVGQGNATGQYNLSGGSAIITNWIAVGRNGGIGTVNISGGSLTKAGDGTSHLTIGSGGVGTVNQTGGTIVNTVAETFIGETQTGLWNLNAGTAVLGVVRLPLNNNVAGTLNLNGGSMTVTELSCTNASGLGTLNFNGGTLVAGSGASANFLYGIATNTVLAGGAVIDSGANSISSPQSFLGVAADGGLTKLGSGALYLNGVSTYTNVTRVNAGALGGSGTLASPVSVASGAALAPGTASAIGTLTINNTLNLAAGSATHVKISLNGGTTNDVVTGLTSVTYAGSLVVTNAGGTSGTGTFHLFNAAAHSGNFSSITVLPSGSGTFDPATGVLTLSVVGNGLAFNPAKVSGGNLILTGTGGAPGTGYTLLTTTNLTTPAALWSTNTTGTFGGDGAFSNNIPVSATEPARFFRVRQP
jgi:autotransporter-associated beta strand protein